MASSVLEQYPISDILEWREKKQLELNPDFQRGKVWTTNAKSFFIDSILRGLPVPKFFLRTRVDLQSKRSFREVVDGQQRLRTIIDFSNDDLTLNKRAGEFRGMKYSELPDEYQEAFLSYPLSVDQLMNASDADVLEVFARINSYNVTLNAPESRHAQFQGDFKWVVHLKAREWSRLWEEFEVVSTRQRVRLMHDSFTAEMFGVLMEGVTDGGQPKINRLYTKYDDDFPEDGRPWANRLDETLKYILKNFGDVILDTSLASAPHFLMLFAAVAHARRGIPKGDMGSGMPRRRTTMLRDLSIAEENLGLLADVIASDHQPRGFARFWPASKASTQRIASRRVRFPVFYRALGPKRIRSESA